MGRKERGTINPYKFYQLRKNHTVREIALIVGYSEKGLLRWCYRNGVETKRIADWEIAEEIKKITPKEIAYNYNVNLETVYYRLRKMGISPKLQRGIK